MHGLLQLAAQRVSPQHPENRRRGRRSKTCPVHDLKPDIVDEIRGLQNKSESLPMLSALCNDMTLLPHSDNCSCADRSMDDKDKRLSVNFPSSNSPIMNEPGTILRPMSWHSTTFDLTSQLQAFDTHHIDNDPPYQNLPVLTNGGNIVWDTPQRNDSAPKFQANHVVENGWLVGSNGLVNHSTGYAMFPPRITSGGHSPNSSDTIHQQPNLGFA